MKERLGHIFNSEPSGMKRKVMKLSDPFAEAMAQRKAVLYDSQCRSKRSRV